MRDIFKDLDHHDWENFARDVLFHLGYDVVQGPAVGRDDGVDLLVSKAGKRFLVSCKHYQKPIGVSQEKDIRDCMEDNSCEGFIAFYSSSVTSRLKKKFTALREQKFEVIEYYRTNILDIIPTMMGFVLEKYFAQIHEFYHHVNTSMIYKPLPCVKGCGCEDILTKEAILWSMVTLVKKENKLCFEYGCKECLRGYPELNIYPLNFEVLNQFDLVEVGWMEISQIRFFDQFFTWRDLIEESLKQLDVVPDIDFYKNLSTFNTALMQVMVPQGWGVWLPEEYETSVFQFGSNMLVVDY